MPFTKEYSFNIQTDSLHELVDVIYNDLLIYLHNKGKAEEFNPVVISELLDKRIRFADYLQYRQEDVDNISLLVERYGNMNQCHIINIITRFFIASLVYQSFGLQDNDQYEKLSYQERGEVLEAIDSLMKVFEKLRTAKNESKKNKYLKRLCGLIKENLKSAKIRKPESEQKTTSSSSAGQDNTRRVEVGYAVAFSKSVSGETSEEDHSATGGNKKIIELIINAKERMWKWYAENEGQKCIKHPIQVLNIAVRITMNSKNINLVINPIRDLAENIIWADTPVSKILKDLLAELQAHTNQVENHKPGSSNDELGLVA